MLVPEILPRIIAGTPLSLEQSESAMNSVLTGQANHAQIAAFLVALRMKGETADELAGFASAMRKHSARVESGVEGLLDTCGTGGDGTATFNISTVAAFVVAGAGVPVAKHGNRSFSSHCGSADILEALGVKVDLTPEAMAQCIREVGIGFLFAPNLHPAMRHAAPVRRELKIRTVFNLLGPLTNPAGAAYQLIGAPSVDTARLMAQALARFPIESACVVHGDGLDEVTTTGVTTAFQVEGGEVHQREFHPKDFGVPTAKLEDIQAKTKEDNLRIAREVLEGAKGPARDIVLVNAAVALWIAKAAPDLITATHRAAQSIDTGAAANKLKQLVRQAHGLQRPHGPPPESGRD